MSKKARKKSAVAARKKKAARKATAKSARKATKTTKKRGRKRFKMTGHESILSFVRKAGRTGVPGAEIAKHWKAEGRGAGVYVEIGRLVEQKRLKRKDLKGQRGSLYRAA